MKASKLFLMSALSGMLSLAVSGYALAQSADTPSADAAAAQAPEPLSAEELEILVARIALYPDELVAVIASSSLYPLQIVQAARYLDQVKKKPDLKPDADWDGGVVSLMNYPEIVNMMSDDLDWTEALGEAITYQQKDVLAAIQQLRDKAVAQGTLKSDDKATVAVENDNIVIKPAKAEVVYVPQYEPQMLYEPDYVPVPVTYYPEPYPSYYYPTAPYFAAFVTGAVWGAVVDWDDWGVWGGNGNWGNDIDIDCNNCFNNNNFNGRVNMNDVDWKNVDRSKININKSQFAKLDNTKLKGGIKANDRNSIKNKSADLRKNRPSTLPANGKQVKDVRNSTLEGLKSKPGAKTAKPGQGVAGKKPGQGAGTIVSKPSQGVTKKIDKKPAGKIDRPSGKAKPAARPDTRPKNPSPLGEMNRGQDVKFQSNRGGKSMGGGVGGGGKPQKKVVKRGGGGGGGGGRRR